MIIISPRADLLPKLCSALFFVSFIFQKITIISLHFIFFILKLIGIQ